MCKLTLTAGLCLIIASLASSSRLMCYFNSAAKNRAANGKFTVSDIDPSKCTHLIYAFADISNKHEVVPASATDTQQYSSFNALKIRNPQLKTLLAVGGLTFVKKFQSMVASKSNRAGFIQSAITLLRDNGFDGLNLDWRYPGGAGGQSQNKQRFTLLCQEFKAAFVTEGTTTNRTPLLITASVSAEKAIIDASYEVSKIAASLDFINVLTFDFNGPWESVTGHHSPLFSGSKDTGDKIFSNTDYAMQYWRDQGAPAQKLNMGLAAYGRAFDLSSASSEVGAPANGPGEEGCYTGELGFWASYETCLYIDGVTPVVITDQQVPYATVENQWVGFDNSASLTIKVTYLQTNNFGGAVVWSLDLDDYTGHFCKEGNNPFISLLHSLLVAGFPSTTTPTTNSTTPTTTSTTLTTTSTTPTTTSTTLTTTSTTPTTTSTTLTTTSTTPTTTSTTLTTTSTTVSSTGSGNPCLGKTAGHFTDPTDPTRFYQCDNGRFFLIPCEASLIFKDSCQCCAFP